jgi:hypothetical protein
VGRRQQQEAFLINTKTGERTRINNRAPRPITAFPAGGNYVLWFDSETPKLALLPIATGKKLNLTAATGVKMGDEENDVPDDPGAYGIAGWEKDDKNVLIYDRYDIWSIDPATGHAVNLPITLAAKIKLSSATAQPTAKRNLSPKKATLAYRAKRRRISNGVIIPKHWEQRRSA